jgi:hypothetical protein
MVNTMPKGDKYKLNAQQIEEIKSYQGKRSQADVARQFGVSHTLIWKIWGGKLHNQSGNVNTLDTQILKKLIRPFIKNGIRIVLAEEEINRIKELYEEIKNAK